MTTFPRLAAGRLPVLGHALRLRNRPLEFVRGLRSQGAITRIRLGAREVYVVNSPELIWDVLVTHSRKFDKGELFDRLRPHLGNGLVTSSGAFHHRQRRLTQPAFHANQVARYAEIMSRHVAEWTAGWRPGEPLDLTGEIDRVTLRILMAVLFGPEPVAGLAAKVTGWLSVRQAAMKQALAPRSPWLDRLRSRDVEPAKQRAKAELCAALAAVISGRRAGAGDGDLLSMLVRTQDPRTGDAMTDDEVCDELLTLFVAGTGTLSAALAWTFHTVPMYPRVEAHLHSEVDAVLHGGPASMTDVPRLGYVRQVVQEVLRVHPVWLLMRRAIAPVELDGVVLTPGDEVFFSPHALHRDPLLYPEPDRFDPGRWAHARPPRGAFLPFGAGNRLCVGEDFAWLEMIIMVGTVAAGWRLEPVAGHRVRARIGTVDRPDRLLMTPVPR